MLSVRRFLCVACCPGSIETEPFDLIVVLEDLSCVSSLVIAWRPGWVVAMCDGDTVVRECACAIDVDYAIEEVSLDAPCLSAFDIAPRACAIGCGLQRFAHMFF